MAFFPPRTLIARDGSTVTLRTALPQDAEAAIEHLARMSSDAPWILRTSEERDFPLDRERTLLNEWLFDERAIAIVAERSVPGDSRIVAMAVFMTAKRKKILHCVEIGMGADPDMRGLGIGRALLEMLLDFALQCPGISKVTLRVYPANVHAVHLYQSVGFKEEARIPRSSIEPDGSYHDMIQMAMYVKPGIAPEGCPTWRAMC
jgi:RimJ/RimL family protein N-acetyltransferase